MAAANEGMRAHGEPPPRVALTIAGTDSGGGAGIAADLRTFHALGVFGTLVVTAVTAQNTQAVRGVEILPAAFVDAQLDAVLADFTIDAAKTGMLATTAIVETVAQRAGSGAFGILVVDPVMVASSGSPSSPATPPPPTAGSSPTPRSSPRTSPRPRCWSAAGSGTRRRWRRRR